MDDKMSRQTRIVLDILSSVRCHLTAEEIVSQLEGIGTATVYRALDHLTESGVIKRLSLGKKSAVYEYVRDEHMHLVCRGCGRILDIPVDFTRMAQESARCCGHAVERCDVTAYGLCCDCLNAEERSDEQR